MRSRKNGIRNNVPNNTLYDSKPATNPRLNERTRSNAGSINGEIERASAIENATRQLIPTPSVSKSSGLVQPQELPNVRASSSEATAGPSKTVPTQTKHSRSRSTSAI